MTAETGDGRHIVVVNDTEEILDLFEEILVGMGHRVTRFTYAPHEAATIADLNPDLVIVDFILGGREYLGWQLLQKLRMQNDTADIPLIACTAAVKEVREMEGKLAESNITVVLKPFRVADLERAVNVALGHLVA
ncbi:MAG TPA: response regulator [Candidatus Angelobacter sp.]|nr:response regulator [Candidatus Angelobacter sp.]